MLFALVPAALRLSAARLSQEAAELTPPELAESRLRRIAAAGYYHFESGDSRRGVVLLEEAAAQLEPGPARADVLTRLAYVHSYSDDLAAATDLFLQAAEEAGDDDGLRAQALEGASTQLFRRRRRLGRGGRATPMRRPRSLGSWETTRFSRRR